MPVVRINNDGNTVISKRKAAAKRLSIALVFVGAISVSTFILVSPESGIMVGLLGPTLASLLNLWSE